MLRRGLVPIKYVDTDTPLNGAKGVWRLLHDKRKTSLSFMQDLDFTAREDRRLETTQLWYLHQQLYIYAMRRLTKQPVLIFVENNGQYQVWDSIKYSNDGDVLELIHTQDTYGEAIAGAPETTELVFD